jgi:hypothetical protein
MKKHLEETDMGILTRRLSVAATALVVALTGLAPAQAMPFAPLAQTSQQAPVVNVQFSQEHGDNRVNQQPGYWPRDARRHGGWNGNRRGWDGPRQGYYNGYRGYRHSRPGYRYHNGAWFPLGAFAAGALLGGALSAPAARAGSHTSRHVAWCESRYRTYRASDNTYVANSRGERRLCRSPY